MPFLNPKDIALRFKKSPRWVYQYAHELGGFRIGGSWFFTKEGVDYAIQRRKKMESDSDLQRDKISGITVDKKRGHRLGSQKTQGIDKEQKAAAKRHNLDRFLP
jgi:hypothetical protein